MSRSVRVVDEPDLWPVVDEWAATVVHGGRLEAWLRTACHLEREVGPYLDVLGAPPPVDAQPLRRPVGARGQVAYPADLEVADALAEAETPFRLVTAGRRYAWRGPAFAPVLLEIHATAEAATLEAWWENVWSSWPTFGRDERGVRRPPARRLTAVAQIDRLLTALDQPPLRRRT